MVASVRQTSLPRRPAVRFTDLGFGGAPVGNLYAVVPDDDARATLDSAWDNGIRYFDTAPHYGLGVSERRVGGALAQRPRTEWTLSTKVGRLLVPDDGAEPPGPGAGSPLALRRVFDFTRDGVVRSLEESLTRLGLDRVDVVLVHDPDDHWEDASGQAVPALCALRDEGVIGAVGVGMNGSEMLARFVEQTDVDVVMCAGRYSLLEQPALRDLLPLADSNGVGVLAAGIFNSGLLARSEVPDDAKYDYQQAPEAVLARARRLAQVCLDHGTTLPAAAVHFALAHPAVVSVVLGMGSAGDVADDRALLDAAPPAELWDDLRRQGLLDPNAPVPS